MSKKLISVLLAVVMILAMGTVAMVSASAEATLPELADGYYRYYFYMPNEWKNDYADRAGIYWWEGTDAWASWPGGEANLVEDFENGSVYYYDVPQDVTTIIWNNNFDGGSDVNTEFYSKAVQTCNIGSEYYDVDEDDFIPEGTDNFDGMIYVTDFELTDINDYSGKMTFAGHWCYYYGDGKYGNTPVEGDGVVLTDPAFNYTTGGLPEETITTQDETTAAPTEATTAAETEATTAAETEATEATTAAPIEFDEITLDDGEAYPYTKGDTIVYSVKLTAAKLFENIQATVTYDASVLELVRVKSEDPDIEDWKVEGPAYCPNLANGIVLNAATAGVVDFNASNIQGYNFKSENDLITLTFNVIGEGDTAIKLAVEEMTMTSGDSYFSQGEAVVTEGIAFAYVLTGNTVPEPTEASTAAETEATTAAETEATTAAETEATEATEATTEASDATTAAPAETTEAPDATSATDGTEKPADTVTTGAASYIYVVLAVLALAACAVVVLRKKVNG
ncbi:MAG: cohesin domain-containing protein [Ruminococcus sp.]